MKNGMFWSEIGSGEPGGTFPPRIPRSNLPPPKKIGLSLKEQSAYVFGYYSKDCYLYDYKLVNFPQPIRIRLAVRWPPFYFNNSVPQSMLVITITHSQFTYPWDMFPRHFHVCANVVILSLLHVPQCVTHKFRRCYMSLRHVPATYQFPGK